MSKLIYVNAAGKEVPRGASDLAYQVNLEDPHAAEFLKSMRAGAPLGTLQVKPKEPEEAEPAPSAPEAKPLTPAEKRKATIAAKKAAEEETKG